MYQTQVGQHVLYMGLLEEAQPAANLPYDEVSRIRGQADSVALRYRHHDAKLHRKLAPQAAESRAIFDALEQTRCESLGMRHMAGVAINLEAAVEDHCRSHGYTDMVDREQAPLDEVVRFLAREAITGAPPPQSAARMVALWRPQLEGQIGAALKTLAGCVDDQVDYAMALRSLLDALGLPDDPPDEDRDEARDDQFEDGDESSALDEGEAGDAEPGTPESMDDLEMREGAGEDSEASDQSEQADGGEVVLDTRKPCAQRGQEQRAVGEHCREGDIMVNVCRGKKLTNIRAASADKTVVLKTPREITLEIALEFIEDDELVEVTPDALRFRKRHLLESDRKRAARGR